MKTKIILETLVLAAALTATQAGAAPISLQGTTIAGTYNGAASGILALDNNFQPGSNTSTIDPNGWEELEFFTADALFGIDFSNAGQFTVYSNAFITVPGDYRLVFDFGAGLGQRIGGFTLLDTSGIDNLPVLSMVNDHTIAIDLSHVTWNSEFGSFSAQLDAAAASVPEPGSIGLALAGLTGFALSRRRKSTPQG
ncbi:PEP-CTERM sorting domain-containing protein [Massilia sp. 9I]|uniref:PEP-CTERM sorting domain-containing protein n=1 Tax=Massilia sp. 9I TaxID=2653152 RepID=UPI0012F3763F|nr:PEP-CTERM sorting domain-containing protein [Massilia sp. 9I]VXB48601.1 PEP-CTERM protein-sorting domain-containing protein [Massilia sp. 9I]